MASENAACVLPGQQTPNERRQPPGNWAYNNATIEYSPNKTRSNSQNRIFRPTTSRFQFQMGTHLLKGGLDRPTPRVCFDDPARCHAQVGGEEVLIAVSARAIVDEDPTHRHQARAVFVPVAGCGHHGHIPSASAIPSDVQTPAARFCHHLGRRRLLGSLFSRSPHFSSTNHRRLSVQIGVGVKQTDHCQPPAMSVHETCQRMGGEITASSCRMSSAGVLCCRQCFLFHSGLRYKATRTGSAHGRAAKGKRTKTVSTTHLCPQRYVVYECVDRTASRCRSLP